MATPSSSLLDWLLYLLGVEKFVGPRITVTFVRSHPQFGASPSMSIPMTGTVTLDAPDPRVSIAKRPITVTVGTNSPISLDGMGGPVTFAINEDDPWVVTAQNISKGGQASPVTTVSGTAVDTTTVPVAPGVTVGFVLADAPAPAPAPTA